jgi:hypothetical protein
MDGLLFGKYHITNHEKTTASNNAITTRQPRFFNIDKHDERKPEVPLFIDLLLCYYDRRFFYGFRWRCFQPEEKQNHDTRCIFCCLCCCTFCSISVGADSLNTAPEGYTLLFNGEDFTNWRVPEGDNGHWRIVDGVIDYDAQSEAPEDKCLWTEKEYGDFEIQMDWRIKKRLS